MSEHLIAANNLILGTVNFLVLTLPEGWGLMDPGSPPEVEARVLLDGVSWTRDGRAAYLLRLDDGRVAHLDLRVASALPPPPPGLQPERPAVELAVNGHPARLESGRARPVLGRFGRARPVLTLGFACPVTGRGLRLTLWGELRAEERSQLVASLAALGCH
ncbi:MAG: hypothetical protein QJR08_02250 [Bacillota bacterium]|nr:hypothetical protein [Bacillota bacterium]